jgi:SAM-dependent methyltransferase
MTITTRFPTPPIRGPRPTRTAWRPWSALTGIDLAAAPIARGRRLAARLGLANLKLEVMDLGDLGEKDGPFDYIIAHGVFSWVSQAVQDRLLEVCRGLLAPDGVAFVSYNVLPGWHLRNIARDVMRFHTERFEDPGQKVSQARAILGFVAEAVPQRNETWRRVLADELAHAAGYEALFHDDLGPCNRPIYLHEFVARAEAAGLQYLADAEFQTMQDGYLDSKVRTTLHRLSQNDMVIREQFLDFINGRGFRQSLLCRAEAELDRRLSPERLRSLFFSCPARVLNAEGRPLKPPFSDLPQDQPVMFQAEGGSTLTANHPVPRAALLDLAASFPARRSFAALLGDADGEAARALGEILLSGYAGDIVQIHAHCPRFAATAGPRPLASPLARDQALEGQRVTNLVHEVVDLEDTGLMRLLPLLDGTRDRPSLVAELERIMAAEPEPIPIPDPVRLAAELEAALAVLARHALLTG